MSTSLHSTSPAPSLTQNDSNGISTPHSDLSLPNRLVKRSTSQRLLSSDVTRGTLFRRPATSHQRSSSFAPTTIMQDTHAHGIIEQPETYHGIAAPAWRPFFNSGYPRKRLASGGLREGSIRTVSASYAPRPTLLNGRTVQPRVPEEGDDDLIFRSSPPVGNLPTQRRHKLRQSIGSIRRNAKHRNFTDPTTRVFKEDVQGSMLPTGKPSPLSPVSRSSTFDFDYPHGTPVFTSSPPMQHLSRGNPFINKRSSVTPSDPNTTSSENDTRVFTDDDDSMDFRSDTAYDSLATRATASSHSGYRQPKIETIFDEPSKEHVNGNGPTLESLMQQTTLGSRDAQVPHMTPQWIENVGIGIKGLEENSDTAMFQDQEATTPVRETNASSFEELNATPVAVSGRRPLQDIQPSSPSSVLRHGVGKKDVNIIQYTEDVDMDGEDSIDWSPRSGQNPNGVLMAQPGTPTQAYLHPNARFVQDSDSSKRSSIFDWSEQQKAATETPNGVSPRPKTVHGKQSNEHGRSRTSGRKERSAVHLRSQSVPVNRESGADMEVPPSAAKFGTWGLGHKPASEEWGDDFEFDDVEEVDEAQITTIQPVNRDSIRSVKVPQAIIDRQASVHIQFGQVQEFMLLVEELRRLRTQGATLQLLQSHSRQLWGDAENIINLATLNDEDEGSLRPPSPSISDIFGEDTSPSSRRISVDEPKRNSTNRRSISSPATPPTSRPRGESLAQARNFLHTIHHNKTGQELSAAEAQVQARGKMPFDTQDLRKLVERAGVITRALKEIVRKAEGVSISPQRTPQRNHDPSLSHIFNPPDASPCPPFRKPGLPKSRSANSYLGSVIAGEDDDMPSSPMRFTAVIEAN